MPYKNPDDKRRHHADYTLKRYREDPKFRRRHSARRTLNHAIKKDVIVPQVCRQCGSTDAQAHHDDYDKPLDVIWLCRKHHEEQHGGPGCREDLDS